MATELRSTLYCYFSGAYVRGTCTSNAYHPIILNWNQANQCLIMSFPSFLTDFLLPNVFFDTFLSPLAKGHYILLWFIDHVRLTHTRTQKFPHRGEPSTQSQKTSCVQGDNVGLLRIIEENIYYFSCLSTRIYKVSAFHESAIEQEVQFSIPRHTRQTRHL